MTVRVDLVLCLYCGGQGRGMWWCDFPIKVFRLKLKLKLFRLKLKLKLFRLKLKLLVPCTRLGPEGAYLYTLGRVRPVPPSAIHYHKDNR